MTETRQSGRSYRFGVFQLDLATGELYKHGIRLKLQDQPIQVLTMLLERNGQVVSREELRQRLWGADTYVDFDHSLNISVNKLRDALSDSAATPRFIETLPRKGYRFIAPITAEEPALPPSQPTPSAAQEEVLAKITESHKWLMLSALGALLLASLLIWMRSWMNRPTGEPQGKMRMAVLPFENLTGNNKEDFFIAGLNEEMITQLGRVHPSKLAVIARTSVTHYGEKRAPIDQIARDLHVSYVVDGSVRQVKGRFRITAMLIQTSDQTQLWADTYDVNMGDILKLQESIARRVSDSLSLEFQPEAERQLQVAHTKNTDAYEAYLRGRYFWSLETRSSMDQAIAEFQRAIQLDPNYAPAYTGLADTYMVLGGYGFVPADQAFPEGEKAARKALELAPNLSSAYSSLGFAAYYYDWNWPEAERLLHKAIDLEPNDQLAHEYYSSLLHILGRLDEAESENKIARELDPMSAWIHDDKGWMLLTRHKPEQAAAEFQKAIELNPRFPAAHLSLAMAYGRMRQYDKALGEVRKAQDGGAEPTRTLEVLGETQALSGDMNGAQATLNTLLSGQVGGRVSPYSVALIAAAMGHNSEALDWLERGYREKETWLPWIAVLTEWDSLRGEPRFKELVRQLKLENSR